MWLFDRQQCCFLVIDEVQFIFVELDIIKLGWGVVKFVVRFQVIDLLSYVIFIVYFVLVFCDSYYYYIIIILFQFMSSKCLDFVLFVYCLLLMCKIYVFLEKLFIELRLIIIDLI